MTSCGGSCSYHVVSDRLAVHRIQRAIEQMKTQVAYLISLMTPVLASVAKSARRPYLRDIIIGELDEILTDKAGCVQSLHDSSTDFHQFDGLYKSRTDIGRLWLDRLIHDTIWYKVCVPDRVV